MTREFREHFANSAKSSSRVARGWRENTFHQGLRNPTSRPCKIPQLLSYRRRTLYDRNARREHGCPKRASHQCECLLRQGVYRRYLSRLGEKVDGVLSVRRRATAFQNFLTSRF